MAESVAYAVKLDAEAGLIGQGWCDRSSKTQGQDDISRINYLLRWTLLRRKKKPNNFRLDVDWRIDFRTLPHVSSFRLLASYTYK